MARTDILARRAEIERWICECQPKAYICRQLKCRAATLESWLAKMGIEYAGNQGRKGRKGGPNRKSAQEYVASATFVYSSRLKRKLIEDGIKAECCERCGRSEWMGKPIPLELHHNDGDRFNNVFSNLTVLCANCHAQTPNHAGRSIGTYA